MDTHAKETFCHLGNPSLNDRWRLWWYCLSLMSVMWSLWILSISLLLFLYFFFPEANSSLKILNMLDPFWGVP
jgi:hypothetical protein